MPRRARLTHASVALICLLAMSACTSVDLEPTATPVDTRAAEAEPTLSGPDRCLMLTEFGLREWLTNQFSGDFLTTVGADSLEARAVESVALDREVSEVNRSQGVEAAMAAARPALVSACQNAQLPTKPLQPTSACGHKVMQAVEQALWDGEEMESFDWHVNAWGPKSPEGKALIDVVDGELLSIAGRHGYAEALAHASRQVDMACELAEASSGAANSGSSDRTSTDLPSSPILAPEGDQQENSATNSDAGIAGLRSIVPDEGPDLPESTPPNVRSCQEVIVYFSKHLLTGDYEVSERIVAKHFPQDDGSLWGALRSANGDPQLATEPAEVAQRICTTGPSDGAPVNPSNSR